MPSNRIASVVHIKFYTQEVNEDRDVGYPVFGDYLYYSFAGLYSSYSCTQKEHTQLLAILHSLNNNAGIVCSLLFQMTI